MFNCTCLFNDVTGALEPAPKICILQQRKTVGVATASIHAWESRETWVL